LFLFFGPAFKPPRQAKQGAGPGRANSVGLGQAYWGKLGDSVKAELDRPGLPAWACLGVLKAGPRNF